MCRGLVGLEMEEDEKTADCKQLKLVKTKQNLY